MKFDEAAEKLDMFARDLILCRGEAHPNLSAAIIDIDDFSVFGEPSTRGRRDPFRLGTDRRIINRIGVGAIAVGLDDPAHARVGAERERDDEFIVRSVYIHDAIAFEMQQRTTRGGRVLGVFGITDRIIVIDQERANARGVPFVLGDGASSLSVLAIRDRHEHTIVLI